MTEFSKKTSEQVISWEGKLKKLGEIVCFDVQLKRNALVYIKRCKYNKEFLAIFIGKWVELYFGENDKYDRTLYIKNEMFLTHKSICIWNLFLKSFAMVCHMIRNVTYNRSLWWMLFLKKSSERVISREGKREKFGEIIFLTYT